MCSLSALDDDDVMHNEKKDQSNEDVVLPPPDEQGTGDNQDATASSSPPQAKKSRRRRRTPGNESQAKESVPTVQETSTYGLIYDADKNPDFDQDDKPFIQVLKEVVADYESREAVRLRHVEQVAHPLQGQEGRCHQ